MDPARRLSLRAFAAGACIPGLASLPARAADAEVWIAFADDSGPYAAAAQALQETLAREPRLRWRVGTWAQLPAAPDALPQLVVTLGLSAFSEGMERAVATPELARPPWLAALLPQAGYQAQLPRPGIRCSAVWLDQPPDRIAQLLRVALPDARRIGVLFGPDSQQSRAPLARALAARGLTLVAATVLSGERAIYPALRELLAESDLLLALPDKQVFHPNSVRNILIASYRQRIPLVSYSAAHVRAGALLALYTGPADIAPQLAAAWRQVMAGRGLPPPRASDGFSVAVNEQVARSLDLALPGEQAIARALQSREAS